MSACFYGLPAIHFEDVGGEGSLWGVELCWEGETVYLSVISDPDKSFRF